jgi:hypothetical protein
MPFENYSTDASGVGCVGLNCRPTEGVIKPRLEEERGLETKYKNQYETQIGETSKSACVVNADSMNSGRDGKKKELLDQNVFYQKTQERLQKSKDEKLIIHIKNKVVRDAMPCGLVKLGSLETLVNRLCTKTMWPNLSPKLVAGTTSHFKLLADEFVEFCYRRRNVKSASGLNTFIILSSAKAILILF